jgi:hypothetical protein
MEVLEFKKYLEMNLAFNLCQPLLCMKSSLSALGISFLIKWEWCYLVYNVVKFRGNACKTSVVSNRGSLCEIS